MPYILQIINKKPLKKPAKLKIFKLEFIFTANMGYLSRKKLCTKMLIFFSAHDIVYFVQIESVPERNIACRALVHAASVSGNQRPPEEEARQSVGCVGVAWTLWQRLQRLRCVWRIKLI